MKPTLQALIGMLFFTLVASSAYAAPFSDKVTNDGYNNNPVNGIPTAMSRTADPEIYPDIFEAINKIMGTAYTSNSDIDPLFVDNDYLWKNTSGKISVIGYSVSSDNTLGVYSSSGSHDIASNYDGFGFDNVPDGKYDTYDIGVPDDEFFGWYLKKTFNGTNFFYFYSESALNPNGMDHMMTFDLGGPFDFDNGQDLIHFNNPYLITWENIPWDGTKLGDEDYNDLIYLVDATPVPEPTTILLFGTGLVGLAWYARRKTMK